MDNLTKKSKIKIILEYFLGYNLLYPLIAAILFSIIFHEIFDENVILQLVNIVIYVYVFIRIVFLARAMLKEDFKVFKANLSHIIFDSGKVYIKMLLTTMLINIVVMLITNSISNNQAMIEDQFLQTPLLIVMISVVFAPIIEEIVFRGAIFNMINSKLSPVKSAVISGLLFGVIHVILSLFTGQYLDLLNVFSYGAMGYFLGMHYYKSKTIFAPILVHFLNNFIAILLMLVAG